MIALVNYMSQILLALIALANLIVSFTKALASASRINEVFELTSDIVDGEYDREESNKENMVIFDESVCLIPVQKKRYQISVSL